MEVSDIIDAVDIAEYIGQYVDLEEKGGEFWGLSPFKDERTPSFSINPSKGYWFDFSSGQGGNILDFIMKHDGVSLYKAIEKLKTYAGITDDAAITPKRLSATKIAKKFRDQNKKKIVFNKAIPESSMQKFVFDTDKLSSWVEEGIDLEIMRTFGVRYDPVDNRIVYPVRDYDGNMIAVHGRTCDSDFKQKGIRKYTFYGSLDGSLNTLIMFSDNREHILSAGSVILFEGFKSCLKAYGWGYKNVAALSTSHLSPSQLSFLIGLAGNYGVRMIFALDSDVDIMKDKNIQQLRHYANVSWVKNRNCLLADKDAPVDRGRETFELLYEERERL